MYINNRHVNNRYVVRFDEATTLDGMPYQDWRRTKYIGKEGVLYVVSDGENQRFQWNVLKDGMVDFGKGLVSSNDDIIICNDRLTVKTENSYYYFSIINRQVKETDSIKLW